MSTNSRTVSATPEQVWEVLSDGWLYPVWVVGATRMREVDDNWPDAGARLHHSVGTWPLVINDSTEVLECHPGSFLRLRARAWPGGEGEVEISLRPAGSGTEIVMTEDVVSGPARFLPSVVRHPLLGWRNVESLRRLAFIVERRPREAR